MDATPFKSAQANARTAELAFSNPHARAIDDTPTRLVIDIPDVPGGETSGGGSGTRVSVTCGDAVTAIEVSRSLYTSNEIYFVVGKAGSDLLVTDHFLTALRRCPADGRTPDDGAVLDHFLFRTVPGEGTYARDVIRLGHGRTVRWVPGSPRLEVVRQQRLDPSGTLPLAETLRSLEESLADVVGQAARAGATNLLSGGIDSTLLQTFLPPGSASLSVTLDSREFIPETERAVAASGLTAARHRVVPLRERDYLDALERFVGTVGLPPHHMQSVLLGELFSALGGGITSLLTAQLADALFGLASLTRPAATLRRWGWVPMLTTRMNVPAQLKSQRLSAAEAWFSLLREPVSSPRGLAARAACYTDFAFLESIFGVAAIESRLSRRLQYVLERCPSVSTAATGADAQLEAAHLVDFFCDDALSIWRQAAMSYGSYLVSPFTHPTVVRCAFMLPRRDRYWGAGETKPALKTLLRKRLPAYDTRQPKLSFGLPLQRFLDFGPLSRSPYFTPPEFFPRTQEILPNAYPAWIAWSVLTLSAWRALAGTDDGAPPISFSRRFRW
jgi:asparagine synthase (glutamine-hydrolysing)